MLNPGSISTSSATRPTSISVINTSVTDCDTNTVPPTLDTPTINLVLGLNNLDAVQCGVPTRTTPTLTPTTLRSIEQTFEEISKLEPPETHTNQAGFVPPLVNPVTSTTTFISTIDKNHWGGGVATINQSVPPASNTSTTRPLQVTSFIPGENGPVVDTSTKSTSLNYFDENSCDSTASSGSNSSTSHSLISQGSAAIYTPVLSSSGTTIITPSVTPAPAILAAQVQNNRRMGGRRPLKHEKLTPEEEERRKIRRERNKQAAARCRKRRLDQTLMLQDETDSLEEKKSDLQNEIQILQQQRDELEFLLATHKPACRRGIQQQQQPHGPISLSSVPTEQPVTTSSITVVPISYVKDEPTEEMELDFVEKKVSSVGKPRRPTSLAVPSLMLPRHSSVNDLGVSIETPSAGLKDLNFESIIDGETGLTPVTNVQPVQATGLTPLNTPIVSLPSTNCGSQQRSSSSDLSSPESVPPKLVSL